MHPITHLEHRSQAAQPHHRYHKRQAQFKFGHAHALAKVSPEEKHEQLTQQVGKWVAQTFYGEMLKQARQSPFKSKLFDGGRGGEAYQEMADEQTAEGMASGAGHKLVDAIVRRIEAKTAYASHAKPAATTAAPPAVGARGVRSAGGFRGVA